MQITKCLLPIIIGAVSLLSRQRQASEVRNTNRSILRLDVNVKQGIGYDLLQKKSWSSEKARSNRQTSRFPSSVARNLLYETGHMVSFIPNTNFYNLVAQDRIRIYPIWTRGGIARKMNQSNRRPILGWKLHRSTSWTLSVVQFL